MWPRSLRSWRRPIRRRRAPCAIAWMPPRATCWLPAAIRPPASAWSTRRRRSPLGDPRGAGKRRCDNAAPMLAALFWICVGLLVYTQVGYALLLAALAALRPRERAAAEAASDAALPVVSLIVAAHAEEAVIAAKVANALALDYPRDRLEVIVSCDGSPDATAELARGAGADLVLELPRGGKIRAQDAAVERARGDIVAFSDANALWERDALRALTAAFADPAVGYACGQVRFVNAGGTNQEGLYWRYELAVRAFESRLASVSGGNGAISAPRRTDYLVVDPIMGHDLSFPFNMVKRGRRAVYVPGARATEKM